VDNRTSESKKTDELKKIDELSEEDLKAVAGGATTEENTSAQNNTLNNSKVSRSTGSIDKFTAS
jgi:hypothetical protein